MRMKFPIWFLAIAPLLSVAFPRTAAAQASLQVQIGVPTIRFETAPALVEVSPGIQVVPEYEQEVFFVDGWYWHRAGRAWYRTRDHRGGWVVAHGREVPRGLLRIPPAGTGTIGPPVARTSTNIDGRWQRFAPRANSRGVNTRNEMTAAVSTATTTASTKSAWSAGNTANRTGGTDERIPIPRHQAAQKILPPAGARGHAQVLTNAAYLSRRPNNSVRQGWSVSPSCVETRSRQSMAYSEQTQAAFR
jgi:hypothetical protein